MDALEFLGHGLYFTLGVAVGTALMYFGPLIIEWVQEGKKK